MSDKLREQIRNNLEMKDLYELLEIWKTNDRVEWSDTTFEVLREILIHRIGELPPQNAPVLAIDDDAGNDGLEEWQASLLDREDQPELYNTLDVIKLIEKINKIAIVAVIIYALLGLFNLSFVRMLFQGVGFTFTDVMQSLPQSIFTILGILLILPIIYFPLKALALILRILMEMEFNSRKQG